jgi:hypothetical protein
MHAAEEVTAKRFVLVDDQGDRRAELSASEGMVGLTIFGKEPSHGDVSVGVYEESGEPIVMVRRAPTEGEEGGRVMVSVTDEGKAAILLKDADGTKRTLTSD